MPQPFTRVPIQLQDGKVIIDMADFQKLIDKIPDQAITYETNLTLKPKPAPKKKRGPYNKKKADKTE